MVERLQVELRIPGSELESWRRVAALDGFKRKAPGTRIQVGNLNGWVRDLLTNDAHELIRDRVDTTGAQRGAIDPARGPLLTMNLRLDPDSAGMLWSLSGAAEASHAQTLRALVRLYRVERRRRVREQGA